MWTLAVRSVKRFSALHHNNYQRAKMMYFRDIGSRSNTKCELKIFTKKEEAKSWPLLCQVDCSTQALTVRVRLSATSIKIKIGNQNI